MGCKIIGCNVRSCCNNTECPQFRDESKEKSFEEQLWVRLIKLCENDTGFMPMINKIHEHILTAIPKSNNTYVYIKFIEQFKENLLK